MADPKMAEAPVSAKKTFVEDGTEFKGSLVSKCPVIVSGKIDGEVHAPSLTVSGSGGVYGKVRVGDITSEGELAGEFEADSVRLSGRINNNTLIRAKSIEVKLVADKAKLVTFGDCVLEVGEEPKKGQPSGTAPKAAAPDAPQAPKASKPQPPPQQPPPQQG